MNNSIYYQIYMCTYFFSYHYISCIFIFIFLCVFILKKEKKLIQIKSTSTELLVYVFYTLYFQFVIHINTKNVI